jgi:two-component system response regulator (stage 0 sporulation protein A)
MNTKVEISKILKTLGVSPDLLGYAYLQEAIEMAMDDMTILHNGVTKILYPTIAKHFKTTAQRAERAIRHAVETCADKMMNFPNIYDDIFGNVVSADKGKPTNSQFIGCVAEYLLLANEAE